MKTITLIEAYKLICDSVAVYVITDGLIPEGLSYITLSDIIEGEIDDDNEWLYLSWRENSQDYSVKFDEGQNRFVCVDKSDIMYLIDTDGDKIGIKLLVAKEL